MTVTHGEATPAATAARIRLRAEWLRQLAPGVREDLSAVTLREVDARFEAWLDQRPRVGEHGGG